MFSKKTDDILLACGINQITKHCLSSGFRPFNKKYKAEQLSLKQWLKYGKLLQGAILQARIINAFKQSFLDAAQFGCRWYG
jgi:hypothetical protein